MSQFEKFNRDNYEQLLDTLKFYGIQHLLKHPLKIGMQIGKVGIKLSVHQTGENWRMNFAFLFWKGENNVHYNLSQIMASLEKCNSPIRTHVLHPKNTTYNLNEIKNLLEGRSVLTRYHKDGKSIYYTLAEGNYFVWYLQLSG